MAQTGHSEITEQTSPSILGNSHTPASDTEIERQGSNGVLELIAGEFRPYVQKIWIGQKVFEYLAASNARRHLWHVCLTAEQQRELHVVEDPLGENDLLYRRFTFETSRQLQRDFLGQTVHGLDRALEKLGPAARRPPLYLALVRLLTDGGIGAKTTRHLRALADETIMTLVNLPERLRTEEALKTVENPSAAAFFDWVLERIEGQEGKSELRSLEANLLKTSKPKTFLKALRLMVKILAARATTFPQPPWEGSEKLRPLKSFDDVKSAAHRFENCLERQIDEVLTGQEYFYEWSGSEPAIVGLEHLLGDEWVVGQICGIDNEDVTLNTALEIAADLAAAPNIFSQWIDLKCMKGKYAGNNPRFSSRFCHQQYV